MATVSGSSGRRHAAGVKGTGGKGNGSRPTEAIRRRTQTRKEAITCSESHSRTAEGRSAPTIKGEKGAVSAVR